MEEPVKNDGYHENFLHDDACSVAVFLFSNRFGLVVWASPLTGRVSKQTDA